MRFLLPRDDYFFTAFPALAAEVQQAAALLGRLLDGAAGDSSLMSDIDAAKNATDAAARELINRLGRTFVTPFDREDIHRLAQSLVAVTHSLCDAATLIPMRDASQIPAPVRRVTALVHEEVEQLGVAVAGLRRPKTLGAAIASMRRLDDQIETMRRRAVADLLNGPGDPIDIVKWKDILDGVQRAANACEEATDVIEGIAVKG